MNQVNQTGKSKLTVYVVAILATFLLMAFLVRQMMRYTNPTPVGADRGAARAKDNKDIRATGTAALNSYGYVGDPAKGVVRMPIEEAMKLTVQGYKDAAGFHSNLVSRVEKANVVPPKPAAPPNPFE
jgi:hypothetical protein